MKYDYSRLKATAERRLARFGMTAYLVKVGPPGPPEWDPTPGTRTLHEVIAVNENQLYGYQAGALVQEEIRGLLISTSAGIEPRVSDAIVFREREYQITGVAPIAPAETVLLWQVTISA